jgi:outer membrane PBP1 activator LpoA protein
VIFLAAGVTQGRSIRPQLRFNYAGDIPVYASSRIFSGRPDRTADQDLNGVRFPTTPLQLEADSGHALTALSSLRGGVFTTLYALGKDAWNLLPWLDLMQRDADFRFAGASGYYHAGPGGKLLREPVFAVFSGGRPVPLARAKVSP